MWSRIAPHHTITKRQNGQNLQMVGEYFVLLIDKANREHSINMVTSTNLKYLNIIVFWILYVQKSE